MKENREVTDTNVEDIEKNSIEEDIKNAEHFIKSIKTDKEYKEENRWHGYYNKEIVELARILEHILSDYKRVLKEKDKIINLMSEQFAGLTIFDIDKDAPLILYDKEEVKQYFENKAKEK